MTGRDTGQVFLMQCMHGLLYLSFLSVSRVVNVHHTIYVCTYGRSLFTLSYHDRMARCCFPPQSEQVQEEQQKKVERYRQVVRSTPEEQLDTLSPLTRRLGKTAAQPHEADYPPDQINIPSKLINTPPSPAVNISLNYLCSVVAGTLQCGPKNVALQSTRICFSHLGLEDSLLTAADRCSLQVVVTGQVDVVVPSGVVCDLLLLRGATQQRDIAFRLCSSHLSFICFS